MQVENNRNQIDCYQNVGTKLTVTPKCRDQNGVYKLSSIYKLTVTPKFRGSQMLYTTQFINIFFIYNSRLQKFEI